MKAIKFSILTLAALAAFASCKDDTPPSYAIKVTNDGNGTATASAEVAQAGTSITLTAEPNDGFVFAEWTVVSGDAEPANVKAASTTFDMPAGNVEIKAVFVVEKFSVTVTAGANGTAVADVTEAAKGATVKLTATANPEFEFSAWTLTGIELAAEELEKNPLNFTMPENAVTAKAEFRVPVDVLDVITDEAFKTVALSYMDKAATIKIDEVEEVIFKWDADGNGKLSAAEAAEITMLDLSGTAVKDLSGIEYFTGLTHLDLSAADKGLKNLDLSANKALVYFNGNETYSIESITIGDKPELEKLILNDCNITEIDLTGCPKLTTLSINWTNLATIDLTQCTELVSVDISSSKLAGVIDISKNTKLTTLYIGSNKITSLTLGDITELTAFYCHKNDITSLDISKLTKLTSFRCYENKLTTLDITKIASTTYVVWCGNQKDNGTIELKLRPDQETRWTDVMLVNPNHYNNGRVNVTVVN